MRTGIVGYENIIRLGDTNKYLIGTTSGYVTVDINKLETKDFQIHIGDVNVMNKGDRFIKTLKNRKLEGEFKSNEKNLEISFYTPEFNKYLSTQYQFQLIGIYNNWSSWTKKSQSFI